MATRSLTDTERDALVNGLNLLARELDSEAGQSSPLLESHIERLKVVTGSLRSEIEASVRVQVVDDKPSSRKAAEKGAKKDG